MTDVIERARRWIAGDPDSSTRAELEGLVADGAIAELEDRMNGSLVFGTAGIRGVVEAGSNRMNRAVVIRTTRGLVDFLLARDGAAPSSPVVVGFDARPSSRAFANDTVGVFAAAGFRVRYFPRPVPTPVVAYTAKLLGAIAAVVVTASHNPPRDNGYKVYDRTAIQIVPPADQEIAAFIGAVGAAADVPRLPGGLDGHVPLAVPADADVMERYWEELAALRPEVARDQGLRIVYTPIHGVGWAPLREVMRRAGYDVTVVPEQADPDGRFPTVAFPNPEEPGALDLATELGTDVDADLILANDPDADRLAVATPSSGGYRRLTGNEIGVLLADHLLRHYHGERRPIVVNSIVSTPMLALIGASYGAHVEHTLTGFKWIWTAALELERNGGGEFVMGFEEALGYSVGGVVRDKDGIGAALAFADLAAECRAQGSTVAERLEDLYHRHGRWVSGQRSVVNSGPEGPEIISEAVDRAASSPPPDVAGHPVLGVTDFRLGAESRPRWLQSHPLVALDIEGGRVLVRPSGTEPKLKIYVDLHGAPDQGEELMMEMERVADGMVDSLGL